MQFSKISCLSVLALASSAMAAAIPAENVQVENVHLDKRAFPVAIALVKVIGGQLIAGAAKIAVDATKAHLEVEGNDYKDFDSVSRFYNSVDLC